MRLIHRLEEETRAHKETLYQSDIILACFNGTISKEAYYRFLCQAYHHVKHTARLFMLAASKIENYAVQSDFIAYINEEVGHEQWILSDIKACGYSQEAIIESSPRLPCELFVSYAYDQVTRVNPLGLLGMSYVLEGTSQSIATKAAEGIMKTTSLPAQACSYLLSHGEVDAKHYAFFGALLDKIDPYHHDYILHTATCFYTLYSAILQDVMRDSDEE